MFYRNVRKIKIVVVDVAIVLFTLRTVVVFNLELLLENLLRPLSLSRNSATEGGASEKSRFGIG